MKSLIINADDYGLTPATSVGILKAYKWGIVTGTSVVANGIKIQTSLNALKKFPKLGIGVHLNLVDSLYPMSPLSEVRSLLPSSRPFKNWKHFCAHWMSLRISKGHILNEFARQIQFLIDQGLTVGHIDSHQYIHMLPMMPDIITSLAIDFKIPIIRIPKAEGNDPISIYFKYLGNRYIKNSKTVTVVQSLGRKQTGNITAQTLQALLNQARASQDDMVDITVHPTLFQSRYSRFIEWNKCRDEELQALCSQEIISQIKCCRFNLINYFNHKKDLDMPLRAAA